MRLHSVLAVSFDGVRLDFFLRGLGMSSALVHLDRGGRGVLHSLYAATVPFFDSRRRSVNFRTASMSSRVLEAETPSVLAVSRAVAKRPRTLIGWGM
jgi:hypothetical protein